MILGPRLSIPRKLDEQGVEEHRHWVEQTIHRLTYEAECWAQDGRPRQRERSLHAALQGSSVAVGTLGPSSFSVGQVGNLPYGEDEESIRL
jgi:hypothetical protein